MCRTCVFSSEFEWRRNTATAAPDEITVIAFAAEQLISMAGNVRIVRRLRDYEGISRKPGNTVPDDSIRINISITSDNICHIKS